MSDNGKMVLILCAVLVIALVIGAAARRDIARARCEGRCHDSDASRVVGPIWEMRCQCLTVEEVEE